MTLTFKLERLDGMPAEPPSIESMFSRGSLATRSRWVQTRHFRSFASATTTPTRRRCSLFRTWPKERLAPNSDLSWVREGRVGSLLHGV
jgi:hypothetical protein